ncbi:hypothetical protein ABBQ32_013130 [Trebouxia sp. C0010 RCD-2024]
MTASLLQVPTCHAAAVARSCHASRNSAITRPLLASRSVVRPATRTYAQVSKEDNHGIVQFQPFDEVKDELAKVEGSDEQTMEDSFARAGYSREAEQAVNEQINVEYNMSYAYHAVSSYFNRDNVALPGFVTYFRNASLDERSHAQKLMDFQQVRGGQTRLAHITAPQSDFGGDGSKTDALHAMELALSFEKLNFQKLKELQAIAEKNSDAQMSDFVEAMLQEQAADIKVTADYVAQLRRVSDGHGVWHFDQILQDDMKRLTTPAVESIPA